MKCRRCYEMEYGEDMRILIIRDGNCWEVYYRRTNFPWLFGFGVPTWCKPHFTLKDVKDMAWNNVHNYACMFEEEEL